MQKILISCLASGVWGSRMHARKLLISCPASGVWGSSTHARKLLISCPASGVWGSSLHETFHFQFCQLFQLLWFFLENTPKNPSRFSSILIIFTNIGSLALKKNRVFCSFFLVFSEIYFASLAHVFFKIPGPFFATENNPILIYQQKLCHTSIL